MQVGYRGTMNLIFEIANLMIEQIPHHHADDWPLTPEARRAAMTQRRPPPPGTDPDATLAAASA